MSSNWSRWFSQSLVYISTHLTFVCCCSLWMAGRSVWMRLGRAAVEEEEAGPAVDHTEVVEDEEVEEDSSEEAEVEEV